MRRYLLSAGVLILLVAVSPLSARVWKDATGSFSVEAEFVRVADSKVELRKKDGSVISVAVEKLSKADRDHLAALEKPKPEPKPTTKPGDKPLPGPRVSPTERIEAALRKPAKFEFVDTPLSEVAARVSEQYEIPVWIDRKALAGARLGTDHLITGRATGKPLAEELEKLLGAKIACQVRSDVLMITTAEAASSQLSPRVYKMLKPVVEKDITKNIAPDSWVELGGSGVLFISGKVAVITQTDRLHEAVMAKFSGSLKRVTGTPAGKPGPLDKLVNVEFVQTPLKEVAENLGRQHKLPFELDKAALEEAGVSAEIPVSLTVRGVRLSSALDLLLSQHGLAWQFADGKILLTSNDDLNGKLAEVRYEVRDLVGGDHDPLMELIAESIGPSSWEEVGGPASIKIAAPGTLSIKQTPAAHTAIGQLLADLRAAAK